MNWKAFITVCVSAFFVSFPQNIIGCGPGDDPYDYYTSFFHQNIPDTEGYIPFYYTGLNFLYDENEPTNITDVLSKEWAVYCGNEVTTKDANLFVNKFKREDVNNLYNKIEKNLPAKLPDSVLKNSMANYFIKTKDLEGLGYILYAKQAEPYVQGYSENWDSPVRDSIKMAKLIKNGIQLHSAAKKDIFKLKYGYQVERLAHYSGRYIDAISFYDTYVSTNTTQSILQPLSLALKAGALLRTGKSKEAAYLFSKAFAASTAKRVSNFLSFRWCLDTNITRNDYLSICKNNNEKADMLSLFALTSSDNQLNTIREIYSLNPSSPSLEVLTVREINKLEEKYFTPTIQKTKGGKSFFYYYSSSDNTSVISESEKETKELSLLLHFMAQNAAVKNAGLFEVAAAYTAYMIKDFATAKKYLSAAEKLNLTQKIRDQWALTNLLVTINEKDKIDAAFEEQLLPSIEWLAKKTKEEKPLTIQYYDIAQWKKIYRDLFCEILARKYYTQGDLSKAALCVGAADMMYTNTNEYGWGGFGTGIDYMRSNLSSKQTETLYALFIADQPNNFEKYILNKNSIKKANVIDMLGTAYLREYDYDNAIAWYKKNTDKKALAIKTNPFADLLYDREEQLPSETNFSTTKLAFAEEMQRLTRSLSTDKKNAAKNYYKIATGMYNMTYYGHAWRLVEYWRSNVDGYNIPADATPFEKEYYGCFTAHDYFEKAKNASTDNNFKARCLFMMAKCYQKQGHRPQYEDYSSNWDSMHLAQDKYLKTFRNSKYFPQLVKDYKNTPFYKEALIVVVI